MTKGSKYSAKALVFRYVTLRATYEVLDAAGGHGNLQEWFLITTVKQILEVITISSVQYHSDIEKLTWVTKLDDVQRITTIKRSNIPIT